jgi:hypothetical protein
MLKLRVPQFSRVLIVAGKQYGREEASGLTFKRSLSSNICPHCMCSRADSLRRLAVWTELLQSQTFASIV